MNWHVPQMLEQLRDNSSLRKYAEKKVGCCATTCVHWERCLVGVVLLLCHCFITAAVC